jgi:hypothetical protein
MFLGPKITMPIFETRRRTIRFGAKIWHDISNPYVDNTQEPLVLLLEFLLIKNLHCQNAAFICPAVREMVSK